MDCYYHIKLPNGGEIRVPAVFKTFSYEETEELRKHINDYKNSVDNSKERLKAYVKNNTNLGVEASLLINKIPINNSKISDADLDKFIEDINIKISEKGDYSNLFSAIRQSVYKNDFIETLDDGKWVPTSVSKVLSYLKAPLKIDYFSNVEAETILGGETYNNVHEEINDYILENDSLGLDSPSLRSLLKMLEVAFPNEEGNRTKKIFYKTVFRSDSEMGKDDSVLVFDDSLKYPLFFIQENSTISLPFAVFKYLAITASENNLDVFKNIVQEFNKNSSENIKINPNITPKEFFNGKVVDGLRTDPEFYKILKVKYAENSIKKLIEFMSSTYSTKSENLKSAFTTLLGLVSIKNLSTFNKVQDLNTAIKAGRKEQVYVSEKMTSEKSANLSRSNRKHYFSLNKKMPPKETANDINNFIMANIELGKDLIEVKGISDKTKEEFNIFIVPTYVRVVENGVFIRGWYSKDGNLQKVSSKIKVGEEVKYAKLVTTAKPKIYESEITENVKNPVIIKIDPNNPLDPEVLQKLIFRGSYVKYEVKKKDKVIKRSGVVKNVFPGGIDLNLVVGENSVFHPSPSFSSIVEVHTNAENLGALVIDYADNNAEVTAESFNNTLIGKAHEIIKDLKKYGNSHVKEGDWVSSMKDKNIFHNLVVGVSGDNIYILTQTVKGSRIESINRSEVINTFKAPVSFPTEIYEELSKYYDRVSMEKSLRKDKYSVFLDYDKAMDGDFIWSSSEATLYKITDKKNNELISFSSASGHNIVDYSNKVPKDAVFFTERSIHNSGYMLSIEFNNFLLNAVKAKVINGEVKLPENHRKKIYLIPKDAVLKEDSMLGSGNLNIGFVTTEGSEWHKDTENYVDVTDKVIKMIEKMRPFKEVDESKNKEKDKETAKGEKSKEVVETQKVLTAIDFNNYIKRYDAGLYQSNFSEEKKEFLIPSSFISFKTTVKTKDGPKDIISHKYRILSNDGNRLFLEYNVLNQYGHVITINKYIDLKDAVENIKYIYLMYGNRNLPKLKAMDIKKESLDKKADKKQMVSNIITTFYNMYNIDIQLKKLEGKEAKTKKAYIETTGSGNKIVINTDIDNSEEELLHEYLHLFLAAAKYNNQSIYEDLLTKWMVSKGLSLKGINFTAVEEDFVEEVTTLMKEHNTDMVKIDSDSFLSSFEVIMKQLKVIEEDDTTFSPSFGNIQTVLTILDYKMSDIPMFASLKSTKRNTNVLHYDANFKNWIDTLVKSEDENNKLTINCK